MDETALAFLPIAELARLVAKTKVLPAQLVEIALARIARLNPHLNAYLTVVEEAARSAARQAEHEIRGGHYRGPLHGIPVSLKDNIWTRGVRTTAGSKILREFVPAEDATVASRLRRAGAILLGKTNLHEFAYGVTTENLHYGPARNPWAPERTPGGSSGGSAAAVAAGMCWASLGSDTGGSIRIPAALCGVVGLKPTLGRVSCYGVVPLARTLDHVGPLARTVTDATILLHAIAGRDPRDPFAIARPVPAYPRELRRPLGKTRLGWPRDFFFDRVDEEIRRALEQAARVYERLGASMEEVSLPHLGEWVEPTDLIALVEARSDHEAAGYFPARAAEYGDDVRKRLEKGGDARAVDYVRAVARRRQAQKEFARIFARVDAILAPTVPIAAPPIGQKLVSFGGEQESVRAALLRLNRPANFAGIPAISLPCAFTREGLPLGMQLLGRAWDEARLLRIAYAYEQATEWHNRHPDLTW